MINGPLSSLATLVDARTRRISSYDRSGRNHDWITVPAGETVTLAQIDGPGCITHLWVTLNSKDPLHRRNLVLRAYWDGQEHPSVEAPIGDFFGQGWADVYPLNSLPLAAAPRDGMAMVCYFPMPFGDGARVTVENQGQLDCESFYYYLDYEERAVGPESGRFHAWYNQEVTAPESELGDVEHNWTLGLPEPANLSDAGNYVFVHAEGRGHYVGVNYYVHSPSPVWYGEGDDMFLIDGEPWPGSAHGTGTEDYFNTAWGPDEPFQHPYFGIARVPGVGNRDPRFGWVGRTHCYRFHFEDPVRFRTSLRASIEHGHANAGILEIASVAYWYQTLPSRPFPALPSSEARKPKPLMVVEDLHRWRHAWRQARGGGLRWGDEGL